MKFYRLFLLAWCLTATLGVAAFGYEKVKSTKLFNGETVDEFKLANGLRVLFIPRHQAKVLTYQTWFDVGSVDEKLDPKLNKTGLAHLFEHMMFRGTAKYPEGKFMELTSRMGASRQNASTSFYRTNYYQSIPSSQLDKLMDMESDRMRNLLLTKPQLDKEKGAVVSEYRRYHLDMPSTMANEELNRQLFDQSPYRWTIIGTEDDIKNFALEEAQYFYKTYYAPNNCTLIVVGDTTESELMKLVERYYGDMKQFEVPRRPIASEPPRKKERRAEKTHPQATSELLLVGYHIPSIESADVASLSLLGSHLSSGMEARLRKALVDTGIAVGANAAPGWKPDVFDISVHVAEGHTANEALRVVDRELDSLTKRPISAQSFERALNQDLLDVYSAVGSDSAMGNILGEYLMLSGSYVRAFEILEASKTLTPKDLMRVAKKYFTKTNRAIVIMTPEKKVNS
jgi:zinc protease